MHLTSVHTICLTTQWAQQCDADAQADPVHCACMWHAHTCTECVCICSSVAWADPVHCMCILDAHICIECAQLCDADTRWAQCNAHVFRMYPHAECM
jgi:hypothetical protein